MAVYGNLSSAAIQSLQQLMQRPSEAENQQIMAADRQADRDRAQQQSAYNIARMDLQQRSDASNQERVSRSTQRQQDQQHAAAMLRQTLEQARELETMKQSGRLQMAASKRREQGATLQPGSGYGPYNAPTTGPRPSAGGGNGMIAGPGGVQSITDGQITDRGQTGLFPMDPNIQYLGPGQYGLHSEGKSRLTRRTPQAVGPHPMQGLLLNSGLPERDIMELASALPALGQTNGISVAKFLDEIESRRPKSLTPDEYRSRRDRVSSEVTRIEELGGDAGFLRQSMQYYDQKMRETKATRINPNASHTIDPPPIPANWNPSDAELQAAQQAGVDLYNDAAIYQWIEANR